MTTTKYVYIGQGEHYSGIPARDLTADDVERLNEMQLAMVQTGVLYQPVAPVAAAVEPEAKSSGAKKRGKKERDK